MIFKPELSRDPVALFGGGVRNVPLKRWRTVLEMFLGNCRGSRECRTLVQSVFPGSRALEIGRSSAGAIHPWIPAIILAYRVGPRAPQTGGGCCLCDFWTLNHIFSAIKC